MLHEAACQGGTSSVQRPSVWYRTLSRRSVPRNQPHCPGLTAQRGAHSPVHTAILVKQLHQPPGCSSRAAAASSLSATASPFAVGFDVYEAGVSWVACVRVGGLAWLLEEVGWRCLSVCVCVWGGGGAGGSTGKQRLPGPNLSVIEWWLIYSWSLALGVLSTA